MGLILESSLALTHSDLSAPLHRADTLSATFGASYTGIMAFMAVATEGSFAKAGERLGISRSAISRNVQKLESQLSTRLFVRTTRNTQLTHEGRRFFDNCHQGVAHMAEAINDMLELRQGPPSGLIKIGAPVSFGRKVLAPLLERFSNAYPDLSLDLHLDDGLLDHASDELDVAFRSGRIEDSSIIARRLGPMRRAVCAAPSYVATNGLPATPEELAHHQCISHRSASGRVQEWEFHREGRVRKLALKSRFTVNNSDLVLHAVLQGWGLAQIADFQIADHVAAHELVVTLADELPNDLGHYICYQSRCHLPARTRVFVDFMVAEFPRFSFGGVGLDA
ncbi:LysR family transcriptional regulator [Cupriavidus agavae]|uniref:LysR family transcriptional regulator n=1 Tax=Cupriavidus agavae TaxID=1001822 RepID=A0A4Q7RB95_9BURK|nr:LysR family transcriptional regulator [Cupriavidus agavae]